MSNGDRPFRILGWHLKLAREQNSETLSDVSGAVEIETEFLENIEQGKSRPTEDVLMLLINHFDLGDAEANSLWELAGYVSEKAEIKPDTTTTNNIDLRIIYTDLSHVMVNDYGVVLNFLQSSGLNNQSLLVSRVGMSKEQARYLLKVLQHSLDQSNKTQEKVLPPKNHQAKTTDNDKKSR